MKCPRCFGIGEVEPASVVGSRLHALRKGRKETLREVAARAQVSTAYLCDIEHGRRRAPPRVISAYESFIAQKAHADV